MLLDMTQTQIDEARSELAALAADEQELEILATQKSEEITVLKATGSKDFATLAALEGQRTALQTMLTEQRGYVTAAQERVTALEAAQAKAGNLAQLQGQAVTLKAHHEETDALFDELQALMVRQIVKITASRLRWAAELRDAQQRAAALYGLHPIDGMSWNETGIWASPLAELGSEIRQALTLTPLRPTNSLMVGYIPAGLGEAPMSLIELARKPVISFFDRPVSLTVATALNEAARAAPLAMSSQDTYYDAAATAPSEGGPTGYV